LGFKVFLFSHFGLFCAILCHIFALDGSTFNTEDVARAIALHEVAHKAEGTAAFGRMAYELEHILKDEKAPEDVKALVGDYRARREGLSELYADKKQSKAQNEYVVSTELVANMVGDLLGNSYFVERMGARNDGAWKRFITALKAAHDGKAAGISKEAQKYLSGLYKSYVKAVDAAGNGVKVSSITDEREKEKAADTEKGVDSEVDERYNKRKTTKYIPYNQVGTANVKYIKAEIAQLFGKQNGIANKIAFEKGDQVYIVDYSQRPNQPLLGFCEIKTIKDAKERAEFVARTNQAAVDGDAVSDNFAARLLGKEANTENHSDDVLYTDTKEFVQEVAFEDRAFFARTLADETQGIKDGEKRVIAVYGTIRAGNFPIYTFKADGYMQGRMLSVDVRNSYLEFERKDYKNGIDTDAEIADIWADTLSSFGGHSEGYLSRNEYGGGTASNDRLSNETSPSNGTGNSGSYGRNYRVDPREVKEVVRKLKEIYGDSPPSKKVSDERKSKKAYRRAEASATLEEAVKGHLEFTDAYAKLRGRSKKEATDILWKALNTAEGEERRRAALDVADFVLDNAVVEAFGEDPMAQENAQTVAILKDYMHKLDLDSIKGEIRNRFGKNNAIHLVWGKREGEVGVAPDSIKNELIEQGITITASNPADIFFEIYDAYRSAKDGLENHARILLKNGLAAEERATLRVEIAGDILRAYEEKGVATVTAAQFYREMASAERRAEFWKKRYYEEIDRNHITNRLVDKALLFPVKKPATDSLGC